MITKEAIEAAARALCRYGTSFQEIGQTLSWVDEKWPRFTDEASLAINAALPFLSTLPIAVEGKVKELEDLRLAAASIREWMPETLPADEQGKVHFARALAESAAEAIEKYLSALISSPGKDGGQEDDRTEGFIAGYDEGLRQSKHEASIVATDALKQAQAVLKTIRRGALAPMGEVIAALTAIDHALEAAPSKETDQ